jgi:hypothetical protein
MTSRSYGATFDPFAICLVIGSGRWQQLAVTRVLTGACDGGDTCLEMRQ